MAVTWSPTPASGPGPARRRKPILIALGVIVVSILLLVTGVVLEFENVVFTTGPSRQDLARTAEKIIRSDVPGMPGKPVLGHYAAYYSPCGHQDGVQPLSADAGATVRFSGVPASHHDAFEKALDDRTNRDLRALPTSQNWIAFATWDSPTATTGTIEVTVGCIPVARWP